MNDMTVGSPTRVIIKFTIPVLAANLLQLTYAVVDTRLVGTFLGDHALAAVGAATVLSSLYIGFFMGIANGFGIITARFFGAKKPDEVKKSFASALILGLFMAVILVGVNLIFMRPVLGFLNVPENLLADTGEYIRIVVGGMIITMVYDVLLASARAVGDSLTPLLTLTMSVGLNIAGDIVFLGIFKTGVWGAAAATVISQAVTFVFCGIYLMKKYSVFRLGRGDLGLSDRGTVKKMVTTGLSMGLMSSMISIGSLVLQTAINLLGPSYIVAQSAARRITEILMSVFIAVGHTMATYCSQNAGAERPDRIREGIAVGYRITCYWCAAVLVIAWTVSPFLIRMLTGSSDGVMIDAGALYLKIDTILYVLVAVIFVLRNSLQGLGDQVTPLVSSGIEMGGKIILAFTLVPALGYMGVILVEPIVWIVMIVPLIAAMRKKKKAWREVQ